MKKEKAKEILKQIRDDAKKKIADAGAKSWSRVATYGDSVALFLKIVCIDKNQTELVEFTQE